MTAADITRSVIHRQEQFVLGPTTFVAKDIIQGASVSTANPTDTTGATGKSTFVTGAATVTGVAAGDIVLGYGVVSGLATDSYVADVFVSGTDTVTAVIENKINTSVTTTVLVLNLLIVDVT